MREFKILRGKWKGKYIIYEDDGEFLKENPEYSKEDIFDWTTLNPEKLKPGNFIRAMDGFVVPVLDVKRYTLTKKNFISHRWFIRFPYVTLVITKLADGSFKIPNNYAGNTSLFPSRIGFETYKKHTFRTAAVRFAVLLKTGYSPLTALELSGVRKVYPKQTDVSLLLKLMAQKEVVEMVENEVRGFIQSLEKDPRFSEEILKDYIADFMKNVRKGSQTHLNSILPLLKLLGKIDAEGLNKKIKMKEVEEVPFEEVPPPKLDD